jgi:hypothetical protein
MRWRLPRRGSKRTEQGTKIKGACGRRASQKKEACERRLTQNLLKQKHRCSGWAIDRKSVVVQCLYRNVTSLYHSSTCKARTYWLRKQGLVLGGHYIFHRPCQECGKEMELKPPENRKKYHDGVCKRKHYRRNPKIAHQLALTS